MRERITFVYPEGGAVDPKSLSLEDTALQGPTIEAIREDKFTFSLRELPREVAEGLQGIDELHLRWTSPTIQGPALEPFTSRLSPGFHLSYTPSDGADLDTAKLCAILQAFGPLDCASPESFTDLREGRHGDTAALYFYQELEDLHNFAKEASEQVCAASDAAACQRRVESLKSAAGLDATFDAASETLKMSASWGLGEHEIAASGSPHRRTEVGILGRDAPPGIKAHEVGVSGLLAVLGDSKEPSSTLFSFPSRHRLAQGSFSASFQSPTGLHPAMQLVVNTKPPAADEAADGCGLYAYLTLPKAIFADRYQLADELLLASKNLSAAPYVSRPVDLEAPAYSTKTWGSSVLVGLARPESPEAAQEQGHAQALTAEVPLHLRYLEPSHSGEADVEVPYPVVFWACEQQQQQQQQQAEHDDGVVDLGDNPFDRLHLGYDGLFGQSTVFWHVNPQPEVGARLMNRVTVPVLADQASQWAGVGTAAAIGIGLLWVLMRLIGVYQHEFEYEDEGEDPNGASASGPDSVDNAKPQQG